MTGGTMTNETGDDLLLLEAAVELTVLPVWVPAARVFQRVHGRLPRPREMRRLRNALQRLEADGLVRVAVSLDLDPTPDGRIAVGLLQTVRGRQPLGPTASIAS